VGGSFLFSCDEDNVCLKEILPEEVLAKAKQMFEAQ